MVAGWGQAAVHSLATSLNPRTNPRTAHSVFLTELLYMWRPALRRYWRDVAQNNADELLQHSPPEEPTGHGTGCTLVRLPASLPPMH